MLKPTARVGLGLILLTACASLWGCSSDASDPGDLQVPDNSGYDQVGGHDDDDHGDVGDVAPNDDPGVYYDSVDGEGESYDESDTSSEAARKKKPKGNNCVKGGTYCGGDKITGDSQTLYRCNGANDAPSVVQKCAHGCRVNPGANDNCAPDPNARVASPVPGKGVTYAYGVKNSRYAAGYHTGEDYATPTGSSAVAVRSGVVRWSNDYGGAYGKWIGLDADNGRTYVYCHLSSRLVTAGTRVSAGQLIARTGATGNVTGPHLHFEDHPKGNFVYAQVRKPSW